MMGGRKCIATPTGETLEGTGQVLSAEGHIITPKPWCMIVDKLIVEIRNDCYTLRYALSSSVENSQILSDSLYRSLGVWNNSGVVKLSYQSIQKVSAPDQYLMKPSHLDKIC